jgi:hypothetical protein
MQTKRLAKEEDGLREATFEPMQTAPPPLARLPGTVQTAASHRQRQGELQQLGGKQVYATGEWPPSLTGQPPPPENGRLAIEALRRGAALLSPPDPPPEERRRTASPLKLVKSSSDGDAETMELITEIALGDDDDVIDRIDQIDLGYVAAAHREDERAAAAMEMTPTAFVDSVWPPAPKQAVAS